MKNHPVYGLKSHPWYLTSTINTRLFSGGSDSISATTCLHNRCRPRPR
ncbi:MAG: hypothetical protein KAR85_06060 [Methanosarcinales archaeon]|nr:hypothetical protein [Methanosarcinales archaeon]